MCISVGRPPVDGKALHLLRIFNGLTTDEAEVDLDAHSHVCIPTYAYDIGHPIRLLSSRGSWEDCVVVSRAPGCNQYVLRMPPGESGIRNPHHYLLWHYLLRRGGGTQGSACA